MQLTSGKNASVFSMHLIIQVCLTFIFALTVVPLSAQESNKQRRAELTLLSTVQGVGDSETVTLGLRFKLQAGWHTYWRSPGLGSYPVKLNLNGSQNVASYILYWPEPERFRALGVLSVGYSGEVILPLVVTLKHNNAPLKIDLFADYLVCTDSSCLPEDARLSFVLGTGPSHISPQAQEIETFKKKVPELNASAKMTIERQAFIDETIKPGLRLRLKATHQEKFTAPKAFLEGPVAFYMESPSITLSSDRKEALFVIDAYKNEKKDAPPEDKFLSGPLTVSLFDGEEGSSAPVMATLPVMTLAHFLTILGAALLGGFILNFMPCVLPVLSLKIFAVLKSQKESLKDVRLEFLLTTAGILASFLLLGAGAALLKSYGVVVGWGMQFQQPFFLLAISIVLVLFTANLWGFFEVTAPRGLVNKIAPFLNFEGRSQHFFMGAFVTLLATPCTAPFLATAISFSLSRGAIEILSIFMVMGIGLALPYILIGLFPKTSSLFPKPGPWMITFRNV